MFFSVKDHDKDIVHVYMNTQAFIRENTIFKASKTAPNTQEDK